MSYLIRRLNTKTKEDDEFELFKTNVWAHILYLICGHMFKIQGPGGHNKSQTGMRMLQLNYEGINQTTVVLNPRY